MKPENQISPKVAAASAASATTAHCRAATCPSPEPVEAAKFESRRVKRSAAPPQISEPTGFIRIPRRISELHSSPFPPLGGGSPLNPLAYLKCVPTRLPRMTNQDDLKPCCRQTGSHCSDTHGGHWLMHMVTIRLTDSRFNTREMGSRPDAYVRTAVWHHHLSVDDQSHAANALWEKVKSI